jgi:hypothetical protein
LPDQGQLDFGCALQHGSFKADYESESGLSLEVAPPAISLVSLVFKFLQALQRVGTVPAIDYTEWLRKAE